MFENIKKFFKKANKNEKVNSNSKNAAKERLHLVLMQDRANVSADFLDLMRQEIIEVIKKYIDVDESSMDVRLTNQANEDGTQGAPVLYANIPILNIKDETRKLKKEEKQDTDVKVEKEDKQEKENPEEQKTEEGSDEINEDLDHIKEDNENNLEEESDKIEDSENLAQDDKDNDIKEESNEENDETESIEISEEIRAEEEQKIEEAKKIVEEENKVAQSETEEKAE